MSGHTARVLHLAQSPDGTTVCSAAADETLRFWRVFSQSASAKKVSAWHWPYGCHCMQRYLWEAGIQPVEMESNKCPAVMKCAGCYVNTLTLHSICVTMTEPCVPPPGQGRRALQQPRP